MAERLAKRGEACKRVARFLKREKIGFQEREFAVTGVPARGRGVQAGEPGQDGNVAAVACPSLPWSPGFFVFLEGLSLYSFP